MKIAIQSKKALPFNTGKGIYGIITIGFEIAQFDFQNEYIYLTRYYECHCADTGDELCAKEYGEPIIITREEINQLAPVVKAKATIENPNFFESFGKILQNGLLLQTQKQCTDAAREGRKVNFESEATDWQVALDIKNQSDN